MSTHRYHRRDLNADLLRAGLGSAACITPLFLLEPGAIASYVLAVPAAFFILFGLRTWAHGCTRVTLDDSGVVINGWTASRLSWRDLETLKLSYFSTRRDREAGWMHLTLRGAGTKLSIHSPRPTTWNYQMPRHVILPPWVWAARASWPLPLIQPRPR
jgi:hypothetical protein